MINIYIGTYHKYNCGSLAGEWVELPVADIDEVLERIAKKAPAENPEDAEFMIQDFENDLNFKIDECDSITELNELAEASERWSEDEKEAFGVFIDNGYDFGEAAQKVKDHEYFYISADNETELAQNYVEDVYGDLSRMPREELERYFDFEAFGRDLAFSFTQTDSGYIEEC